MQRGTAIGRKNSCGQKRGSLPAGRGGKGDSLLLGGRGRTADSRIRSRKKKRIVKLLWRVEERGGRGLAFQ